MANKLQDEIKHWWESTPMTYDWHNTNPYREGTREWFEEVDRRFFIDSAFFAQANGQAPFSKLIPYGDLKGCDVLEIGCGTGAHARLIAESGAKLTAIDLTAHAVHLTQQRLQMWGCHAEVLQMDAESMEFLDGSFDFVWSWGVIHHSSNTPKIVSEIARVLRPGGQVRVMVYNWRSINCYIGLLRGFLSGRLFRVGVNAVLNYYSDGRVAKYYKRDEFKNLFEHDFDSIETLIYGQKTDLVPIPGRGILGKFKTALVRTIPDPLASAILSQVGGFLFLTAKKRK